MVGIKSRESKMGGVASGAAVVCAARCNNKRVDGAETGGWGIRGTIAVSSEGILPSPKPHLGGSEVQKTK